MKKFSIFGPWKSRKEIKPMIATLTGKIKVKGDIGLPQAEEGLRRLVHSINEESNPNPFGALAVKRLLEHLKTIHDVA